MTKIYSFYHDKVAASKLFSQMESAEAFLDIYEPLSVFENSGDNIADKNCYYSELTGCYWIWKNSKADVVGTAHYRRYLLDENGRLLNEKRILEILETYDLITTKVLTLNFPYEYGFSQNHKPYYLQELGKLLEEKYSDIYPKYRELIGSVHTYFGNMLICEKTLYDEYCRWLFGILFELEERIVIDEPDSYHMRIFGFISEFLLYLFVNIKELKPYHTMVGMMGEKQEVRAIKERLAKFFKMADYSGAKSYFLGEYEKRPDILMEASDIGFELHLCMEAISIAEFEAAAGKEVFLERIRDFGEIIGFLRRLNEYTVKGKVPRAFIEEYKVSSEALNISTKLANATKYGIVK